MCHIELHAIKANIDFYLKIEEIETWRRERKLYVIQLSFLSAAAVAASRHNEEKKKKV